MRARQGRELGFRVTPSAPADSRDAVEEEHVLLARLREGDVAAFDAVVRSYYATLCLYAASLAPSAESAEEVVDDVLYEVWERRKRLVITANFKNYLYGAVRNRALDASRRARRRERILAVVASEADIAEDVQSGGTPDDQMRATELRTAMQQAIDQLPDRLRATFALRWYDGLSHAEIALRLGIAVKTVEAHVTRATKRVRRSLARML